MTQKVKIINISPYPPAYALYLGKPRPLINFDTNNSQWVGIWRGEVADRFGIEILKLTNDIEYEIWKPDLRADKIYSHTFEDGITHRSFPAVRSKELFGVKFVDSIHVDTMVREIEKKIEKEKIILHLSGNPTLFKYFKIPFDHVAVVLSFHGIIYLPNTELFAFTKNIPSKLNSIMDYFWAKEKLNKISFITYMNDENIEYLRKIYNGGLMKITGGCDFSFYKHHSQMSAREEMALPKDKKIFFLASNLTSLKQIDKIICVFTNLSDHYDFLLVIAGHGTEKHEAYLERLSMDLTKKDKLRFVGYVTGDKLLNYYNACDFFLSVSKQEGGPVSVMKAFACEVPVISTKTGNIAEVMKLYNCGCLLDIHDYKMWESVLSEILQDKRRVKPMIREVAKKYYHWPNLARKYLDIYRKVAKKSYQ